MKSSVKEVNKTFLQTTFHQSKTEQNVQAAKELQQHEDASANSERVVDVV